MKCADCVYYKPLVQHVYNKETKRLEPVARRRGTCTLKRQTKYTTAVSSCKKFEPIATVVKTSVQPVVTPIPGLPVVKSRRAFAIKFGK